MIINTGIQCSSDSQQTDLLFDRQVLNDSPGPSSFSIQEWYHSELLPGANRSWLALCRTIISNTLFAEFSQTVPKSMMWLYLSIGFEGNASEHSFLSKATNTFYDNPAWNSNTYSILIQYKNNTHKKQNSHSQVWKLKTTPKLLTRNPE